MVQNKSGFVVDTICWSCTQDITVERAMFHTNILQNKSNLHTLPLRHGDGDKGSYTHAHQQHTLHTPLC